MREMRIPKHTMLVINTLTNLDQIGFVQLLIAKMGVYKWAAYCIYFLFLA
jgi:hypothetical protein